MPSITIRDETLGAPPAAGDDQGPLVIDFLTERVTVREIIRSRVYQEVEDYNRRKPSTFRGLVEPTDAETTLNGYKLRKARQIDWKKQFDAACDAYTRNGFLILVDDRQAGALDEEVTLGPGSEVTFLRMVPLVGG
ncbi:MAG: hypothetical protein IPJ41_03210 [Phycisphaerales bacterium]|nr:hypothetical protein [Phycisphaerales bacterium]